MIKDKSYVATWRPICDKQVSIEERDTYRLLIHIHKYHPEIVGKYFLQKNGGFRISSNRISSQVTPVDSGSSKKNEPKKVYASTVDTWKLHGERKVCSQCQREAMPTLHTGGDKLTTSHIGALCLFGCWPFYFIRLMIKRAKRVSMICPLCGHVYGFEYKNAKLTPCKSADSGDLKATARTRELPRASHEERKAGKLTKSAPRAFIIDTSTITNVIVLFPNKAVFNITNRGSPYDEYSSDDCVDDKRWDRRRDLDESRASKAREQSESEGSSAGTVTGDFYARQVCCRECG
ncbi:LOW QUALITY PROTEIN: uncharacterized protein [Temnothorax nylanderi]|uniref:LOW QUALITY PROTEIN: uncharacterized protein n=1 Tax=Temnothorax nylanderi TaxID=102681 RepID=UPI003A841A00